MELIFLGTGGGRINLLRQIRGTGGFRINSNSANIHVDPGPGALLHSLKLSLDVHKLDAVIVTHNHIDHLNDAALLMEAMAKSATRKGGILIGSDEIVHGDERGDKGITTYHQDLVDQTYAAKWGEKKTFKTKKGRFDIEIIETKHDEPTCFGFKLGVDGVVIGYTSDTQYYPGIGENYAGCDYLILNCLKPSRDKYPGHMTIDDVAEVVRIAKPKLAIISHMGMKLITGDPAGEAKKIEKATGIACIAARDGMRIGK